MHGDDFVLLVHDGASTFNQVDHLRATSLAINGSMIDLTAKESAGKMRELLTGGGMKSMTIQASGVWRGATEQKRLQTLAISGALEGMQIDDTDTVIEGEFQVTSFEKSGDHNAEQLYSVTLESADQPTVT